jgi:hypothetical protein
MGKPNCAHLIYIYRGCEKAWRSGKSGGSGRKTRTGIARCRPAVRGDGGCGSGRGSAYPQRADSAGFLWHFENVGEAQAGARVGKRVRRNAHEARNGSGESAGPCLPRRSPPSVLADEGGCPAQEGAGDKPPRYRGRCKMFARAGLGCRASAFPSPGGATEPAGAPLRGLGKRFRGPRCPRPCGRG